MDIMINGQQLDFSLENEKTVGDILHAVEQDCLQNNATIVRICIDDKLVHEDDFEKTFECSIDSVKTMQLETMSEDDVIKLLQDITSSLEKTIDQLLQIPILLQSSKDNEVSSIVVAFTEQFNLVQKLAYFCGLFPEKFQDFVIENQNISTFFQDFTPILQEFESSLASHDTVLTGDLAEYEIVPRLQAFVNASTTLYGAIC